MYRWLLGASSASWGVDPEGCRDSESTLRPNRNDRMLTGSCHCGAVKIQVARKPRRLTSCNCSICRRYATLWGYYDRGKVKIVSRKGALHRYAWGDKYLWLCRCAKCGCVTHWQPISR